MSTEQKSSKATTWTRFIIGVVLMIAGMYVSQLSHSFVETMAEKGIPFDPGKTVAVIGVFLILFPVIKSFFIQPLADAIQNRTVELEKTFAEAESLRTEMTSMKKEYEGRLAETEASARAQIQEEVRKAQEMRQQLIAEAGAKAEEMKRRAQEEIDTERDRVRSDLRLSTVNLALGATEKILGANVDDDRNRKLIEEFIQNAEVPV